MLLIEFWSSCRTLTEGNPNSRSGLVIKGIEVRQVSIWSLEQYELIFCSSLIDEVINTAGVSMSSSINGPSCRLLFWRCSFWSCLRNLSGLIEDKKLLLRSSSSSFSRSLFSNTCPQCLKSFPQSLRALVLSKLEQPSNSSSISLVNWPVCLSSASASSSLSTSLPSSTYTKVLKELGVIEDEHVISLNCSLFSGHFVDVPYSLSFIQ